MNEHQLPKYSIVSCAITGHQKFGPTIQTCDGESGYVDHADIADIPGPDTRWPAIGSRVRGVVLGYRRDGRMMVSLRPRDMLLVQSVPDPDQALQRWAALGKSGSTDNAVRE